MTWLLPGIKEKRTVIDRAHNSTPIAPISPSRHLVLGGINDVGPLHPMRV